MPTVVNGVGTWYYGKGRIHRRKGTCGFCQAVGELSSYDTTLYFVVVFVPLLPLKRYRVLEQCPRCQKHRVIGLKQWEAGKAKDMAALLERLEANPDDPQTIQDGLGLAMAYQDEALFDKLAAALAGHRRDAAAIQAQLGDAYGYFARWPEAEDAYRAALAVQDDDTLRQRLALTLLKQGRPEEARPYLEPVLARRQKENAGMIFLLIEGYQAQGLHREALELLDRRDEAFPDWAGSKEYRKQRKTSERYQNSGKKVASAFLSESSQVGYREGGWRSRVPRIVGPLVVLGLLAWYLTAAVWTGQARKVYLVNGRNKPYAVAVNGRELLLNPGTPAAVEVPEGDVVVESHDPKVKLEPLTCRIETPFLSRPFSKRTFIINPDRLAVLLWEQTVYAEAPRHGAEPHQLHVGRELYAFPGLDYEFADFPPSMQAKKGQTITKTRVALVPLLSS
jgi:tetratricopeptide (TPR) repeat protein